MPKRKTQGPPKPQPGRDAPKKWSGKMHDMPTKSMAAREKLGLSSRSSAGAKAHAKRDSTAYDVPIANLAANRQRLVRTAKAGYKASKQSGAGSARHQRKAQKTATGKINRGSEKRKK